MLAEACRHGVLIPHLFKKLLLLLFAAVPAVDAEVVHAILFRRFKHNRKPLCHHFRQLNGAVCQVEAAGQLLRSA
ncbi:hypothetical protein D3C75_1244070 [compost metagenome]